MAESNAARDGPRPRRDPAAVATATRPALREIALDLIRPNADQPRKEFGGEALLALAESIKARGILQPIVVRPLPGGEYELIAGERRWRAARMAGLEQVPAIVRDTEESERLELALIENMAREDLNPVEEARACSALIEDLGMTQGGARPPRRPQPRRDLEPGPAARPARRGARPVRGRRASEGHGRARPDVQGPRRAAPLARSAAAQGWSVRETERRAKAWGQEPQKEKAPIVLHPDLADAIGAAEDALTAALGRSVRVKKTGSGFRAEFEFDEPREAIELAERVLRDLAA